MRTQNLFGVLALTALANLFAACQTGGVSIHPADWCGPGTLYDPATETCVAATPRPSVIDPCGSIADIPQDHLLRHQSFEKHWYSGGEYGSDASDAWIFLADSRQPRTTKPDYTPTSIWIARTHFPGEDMGGVFTNTEFFHGQQSLFVKNPTVDDLSEQEGIAFSLSRLLSRDTRYVAAVWLKTNHGEATVTLGIGGYGTRGVPPGFRTIRDWPVTNQWSCYSYEWYESSTEDEEWPSPQTVPQHLQIGFGRLPVATQLYVDSFRLVRLD